MLSTGAFSTGVAGLVEVISMEAGGCADGERGVRGDASSTMVMLSSGIPSWLPPKPKQVKLESVCPRVTITSE